MSEKATFQTVDEYIGLFPESTQVIMQQLRAWIKEEAPEAEECISYSMPAYKWNGPLVYFGGYKNHIGFYPTGLGMATFMDQLGAYKTSKGAVQFPLNQPMPEKLIREFVKVRLMQNTGNKK